MKRTASHRGNCLTGDRIPPGDVCHLGQSRHGRYYTRTLKILDFLNPYKECYSCIIKKCAECFYFVCLFVCHLFTLWFFWFVCRLFSSFDRLLSKGKPCRWTGVRSISRFTFRCAQWFKRIASSLKEIRVGWVSVSLNMSALGFSPGTPVSSHVIIYSW